MVNNSNNNNLNIVHYYKYPEDEATKREEEDRIFALKVIKGNHTKRVGMRPGYNLPNTFSVEKIYELGKKYYTNCINDSVDIHALSLTGFRCLTNDQTDEINIAKRELYVLNAAVKNVFRNFTVAIYLQYYLPLDNSLYSGERIIVKVSNTIYQENTGNRLRYSNGNMSDHAHGSSLTGFVDNIKTLENIENILKIILDPTISEVELVKYSLIDHESKYSINHLQRLSFLKTNCSKLLMEKKSIEKCLSETFNEYCALKRSKETFCIFQCINVFKEIASELSNDTLSDLINELEEKRNDNSLINIKNENVRLDRLLFNILNKYEAYAKVKKKLHKCIKQLIKTEVLNKIKYFKTDSDDGIEELKKKYGNRKVDTMKLSNEIVSKINSDEVKAMLNALLSMRFLDELEEYEIVKIKQIISKKEKKLINSNESKINPNDIFEQVKDVNWNVLFTELVDKNTPTKKEEKFIRLFGLITYEPKSLFQSMWDVKIIDNSKNDGGFINDYVKMVVISEPNFINSIPDKAPLKYLCSQTFQVPEMNNKEFDKFLLDNIRDQVARILEDAANDSKPENWKKYLNEYLDLVGTQFEKLSDVKKEDVFSVKSHACLNGKEMLDSARKLYEDIKEKVKTCESLNEYITYIHDLIYVDDYSWSNFIDPTIETHPFLSRQQEFLDGLLNDDDIVIVNGDDEAGIDISSLLEPINNNNN